MKYGVRDVCNVVFRAAEFQQIGSTKFQKGQPVFYIDTAKTSTLEGTADTTYATGGRGNNRLMAWEGNKTMTFTVEDATISAQGLAILSGANLFQGIDYRNSNGEKGSAGNINKVHAHQTLIQTYTAPAASSSAFNGITINVDQIGGELCITAPIFVMPADKDNEIEGSAIPVDIKEKKVDGVVTGYEVTSGDFVDGKKYILDFYVLKNGADVQEIQITPDKFAGYFYVEAETLFRNTDGKDYPAQITIPNVKIQSAFNFSMSADGDPSTFTFTMDAFPGYTYFDHDKKVLCVIQVINNDVWADPTKHPVMDKVGGTPKETQYGASSTVIDPDTDDYFNDSVGSDAFKA